MNDNISINIFSGLILFADRLILSGKYPKDESNVGWSYLFLHVVQRVRRIDGKTDENDVGIRVGQWAETIVIFLTSRIP